ncbi:MAG: nucleoside recognition domain-containing protein, partial [Halanaerobiaceae bacterium]
MKYFKINSLEETIDDQKTNYYRDLIVSDIFNQAENITRKNVKNPAGKYRGKNKIDDILTSRWLGFPIMFLLLGVIFWITIIGANYPSSLLADIFLKLESHLIWLFSYFNSPAWLQGIIVAGIYRTLAWVISVMLPPMAIFFPLFTLLEDIGYLPRVAFNLDYYFKKVGAHGKQALTMSMGFGCNAAGVIAARIIESPRE